VRHVRTFLCHGSHNIEIHDGQKILVGRGAGCDVVLDDDLASREHLRLELAAGALTVTDLGSRNGVLVNGLPIRETQDLHHGDQVTAGRTPLSVVRQVHEPRTRSSHKSSAMRQSSESEATESGSLYELLEGSSRIALEEGDLTTAEGSGRSLLVAIRGFIARGREIEVDRLAGAVALALDLADSSREAIWVERALDLMATAKTPFDAAQSERVAALVVALRPSKDTVQAYLAMASEQGDDESVAHLRPIVSTY